MKHDEVPTTANASATTAWYRSPYLLLPLVLVAFVGWILLRQLASPQPTVVAGTPKGVPIGPNLLKNPNFALGSQGWVAYHNVMPMAVTYDKKGQNARIALGSAVNSVQEIYQFFKAEPDKPLALSGEIDITGGALPADANVAVILIDSSGKPGAVFNVTAANGIGTFPFMTTFSPSGEPKQFVLATIVGRKAGKNTIVTFKHLSVRELGDVPATTP